LRELSAPTQRSFFALFVDRFGVDSSFFSSRVLLETKDEVWVASSMPPRGIDHARPPGLRAARLHPGGIKPTSHFLCLLSGRITKGFVLVTRPQLEKLLLGHRIPWPHPDVPDGFVALRYREDVLGCGIIRSGSLHTLLPTGRRRELLSVLESSRPDRAEL
jgi:hypothetical protein